MARDAVQRLHAPEGKNPYQASALQQERSKQNRLRRQVLQPTGMLEGGEASKELEAGINGERGGGRPLDATVQRQMGEAMGMDFSGVRVHANAKADRLNASIQAKAFTTGQDVFFKSGAYQPGLRGGQELIAHELTHVIQQGSAPAVQTQSEQKNIIQRVIIDDRTETRSELDTDEAKTLIAKAVSASEDQVANSTAFTKAIKPDARVPLLTLIENVRTELSKSKNDDGAPPTMSSLGPPTMSSLAPPTMSSLGVYDSFEMGSLGFDDSFDDDEPEPEPLESTFTESQQEQSVKDRKTSQTKELKHIELTQEQEDKFLAAQKEKRKKELALMSMVIQQRQEFSEITPEDVNDPSIPERLIIPQNVGNRIQFSVQGDPDLDDGWYTWQQMVGNNSFPRDLDVISHRQERFWYHFHFDKVLEQQHHITECRIQYDPGQMTKPWSGATETEVHEVPLFPKEPSVEDVKQGRIGDCYLLAAVMSVVKSDPNLIRGAMVDNKDTVTVRLYEVDENQTPHTFTAKYMKVKKSIPTKDEISFVGMELKNVTKNVLSTGALWVKILEKAYTAGGFSAHNQDGTNSSYVELGMGEVSSAHALEVLTGRPTKTVDLANLQGEDVESGYAPKEIFIFNKIRNAIDAGKYPTLGTKSKLADEEEAGSGQSGEAMYKGLAAGHMYTALGYRIDKGSSLSYIEIRNPWGKTGREYEYDETQKITGKKETETGQFELELKDLMGSFDVIDIPS